MAQPVQDPFYSYQVATTERSKGAKMTIQVGANNDDEISFDVTAFTFKDILGHYKILC